MSTPRHETFLQLKSKNSSTSTWLELWRHIGLQIVLPSVPCQLEGEASSFMHTSSSRIFLIHEKCCTKQRHALHILLQLRKQKQLFRDVVFIPVNRYHDEHNGTSTEEFEDRHENSIRQPQSDGLIVYLEQLSAISTSWPLLTETTRIPTFFRIL